MNSFYVLGRDYDGKWQPSMLHDLGEKEPDGLGTGKAKGLEK